MILDGAPLIAIHKARYYKRKDGLALGPGPFVTGLEYATDCKATVVGKPEKTFFTQVRNGCFCISIKKSEEASVFSNIQNTFLLAKLDKLFFGRFLYFLGFFCLN